MTESIINQEELAAKKEAARKAAEMWIESHEEQNKTARMDLIKMVSERPRDAADFGELRMKHGIPRPISSWIAMQNDVIKQRPAPSNEKRKMYYLVSLENDTEYWKKIVEDELHPSKPRMPSAQSKDLAHSFCLSDEGKKIANWLKDDLRWNGPINWTVFGSAHFLPNGVPVGVWLSDPLMEFVKPVPKGGGCDYCELRELSPDTRPVRKKPSVLPEWMIHDVASTPEEKEYTNSDDAVPLAASRPFFVGEVHFKKSLLGFSGTYVVTDVVSAMEGSMPDIPLPKVSPNSLDEGEFVIGLNSTKPFLFFNQKVNSAVQILLWESFKESANAQSAEAYFLENPTGSLSASFKEIIGSEEHPGHVIIMDGGMYLKGFSSIGKGLVRYFKVEKYDGDFLQVSSANQVTEMRYRGQAFAILVPPQQNEYAVTNKHAVIDCDGWVPLSSPNLNDAFDESVAMAAGQNRDIVSGALNEQVNLESSPIIVTTEAGVQSQESASLQSVPMWDETEMYFLENFKKYASRCGFVYDDRDLVRFHTSVKSGCCTLLAGDPGSGKSSIVELYARALAGRTKDDNLGAMFHRVDVNPSWMEPADLMGYAVEGVFRPAGNGLYDFLHTAKRDSSVVSLVCLEEINLARVEHYFSDFIQAFSRGGGTIHGYARKSEVKGDTVGMNDAPKPAENGDASGMNDAPNSAENGDVAGTLEEELELTENIRFVGTCNADESTRAMSDRLYDRVNHLEFRLSDKRRKDLVEKAFSGIIAKPLPYQEGEAISATTYLSWASTDGKKQLLPGMKELFEKIQEKLKGANLDPSPRVLSEMAKYIVVRPIYDCKTEEERQLLAFDEQITQRILARSQATPGTIAALEALCSDCLDNGLALSAETLKVRIEDYRRMMAI